MHEDPAIRLQFSHWNTVRPRSAFSFWSVVCERRCGAQAMCEWAASDWSDEVRAEMPRAHTYKYDED